MANFNKVLLIGNLTRDPQLSYLPSQTAVVEFGLAVNRKWTSKEGQGREEVCFVDCRAFGKPAETLNKYCKKGRPLFIEGRLTFDQWTAKDGTKRSKHQIMVESFQFLDSPSGAANSGTGAESAPAGEQEFPQDSGQNQPKGGDDIPF